jgi:PAS domain S-box-containing protein
MNQELSSYSNENEKMALLRGELYRAIVENTPDLITRWDKDLKLIFANSAFEAVTGVPNSSLYGKNYKDMGRTGDIVLPWMKGLREALETRETADLFISLSLPGGVVQFHLLILPEKAADGNVESALAIARDISHIKRTADQPADGDLNQAMHDGDHHDAKLEEKGEDHTGVDSTFGKSAVESLKEKSHYLQRIQETVPDMISIVNLVTRQFEYLNSETFKMHGFDPVLMTATSAEEQDKRIHTEDRQALKNYFEELAQASDNQVVTAEYRAMDDNSQWKHFLVRGRPFQRNEEGAVTHALNIIENITDRKKTELEIIQLKDLLHSVFNAMPGSIAVFKTISDIKGHAEDFQIFMINDFTLQNMPASAGMVGKRYSEAFPAASENGVLKKFREVAEKGKPLKFELLYSGDGLNNWFAYSVAKMDDMLIVITEDITEKKLAEQKVKQDAHFIRQVMETTPDVITIMDLNSKQLIYANRQIAADLGYSQEQIAAMKNPVFDIMYQEDIPLMNEHFKRMKTVTQDDKVLQAEYRLIDAKGAINWFCDRDAVFKRNARGIPVEKIGITQNITDEKLHEEQIITSHDILAQAEEIAEMGSWEYDILTGAFKWSEGMYRLFNLPMGKRVSPDIYFSYTPEEEYSVVNAIVNNIKVDFMDFEEVITLLPKEQEKKVVKIKAIVIKDKKKRPVRVAGVDLDVTYHVKAAKEISELNRILIFKNKDLEMLNQELKTFNTVASKDYKETIQTLYTNLEYIVSKEARNLSDTAKANIRRAQAAIQKMKLLTEDINAYLRLYDLGINKTLIDPNNIVTEVLFRMKGKIEQAGATVEVDTLPPLYADPLLFSILITHLLDNALKFRKLIVSSNIKVKYSQADEMNTVEEAIKNMPYTIITVFDNGIGFPEEESERLFDLFFRLENRGRYRGSGIGLAVCKKIMTMHAGFISAESTISVGTTFSCYFPAASRQTDEALL